MDWVDTPESSNILRFAYEKDMSHLVVEFKKGGTYQYFDVPETTFDEMKLAESKGKYLAQHIKGRYRYARA